MQLTFNRELCPIKSNRGNYLYQEDKSLQYVDWMGQFILQSTTIGTNHLVNCKLPSETKKLIHPLTANMRGRIVDTPATFELLKADFLSRNDQENLVKRVFESYGHSVEFIGNYICG